MKSQFRRFHFDVVYAQRAGRSYRCDTILHRQGLARPGWVDYVFFQHHASADRRSVFFQLPGQSKSFFSSDDLDHRRF